MIDYSAHDSDVLRRPLELSSSATLSGLTYFWYCSIVHLLISSWTLRIATKYEDGDAKWSRNARSWAGVKQRKGNRSLHETLTFQIAICSDFSKPMWRLYCDKQSTKISGFVCSLFNDAITDSAYSVANGWMIVKTHWNGYQRKGSWPNLMYTLDICP